MIGLWKKPNPATQLCITPTMYVSETFDPGSNWELGACTFPDFIHAFSYSELWEDLSTIRKTLPLQSMGWFLFLVRVHVLGTLKAFKQAIKQTNILIKNCILSWNFNDHHIKKGIQSRWHLRKMKKRKTIQSDLHQGGHLFGRRRDRSTGRWMVVPSCVSSCGQSRSSSGWRIYRTLDNQTACHLSTKEQRTLGVKNVNASGVPLMQLRERKLCGQVQKGGCTNTSLEDRWPH